jgi:SET domain-containing protein
VNDVTIRKGNIFGKGFFAIRDIKKGEEITTDATKDNIQ